MIQTVEKDLNKDQLSNKIPQNIGFESISLTGNS